MKLTAIDWQAKKEPAVKLDDLDVISNKIINSLPILEKNQ